MHYLHFLAEERLRGVNQGQDAEATAISLTKSGKVKRYLQSTRYKGGSLKKYRLFRTDSLDSCTIPHCRWGQERTLEI